MSDHADAALAALGEIDTDGIEAEHERAVDALHKLAAAIDERDAGEALDVPDDWDDQEWSEAVDKAREDGDVPSGKGTVTEKEINGNRYYYLQWREGEKVVSQYLGPVDPA